MGTRKMFEEILLDEEHHKAWLELQLDLLKRMGEQNFIAKYSDEPVVASATPVE